MNVPCVVASILLAASTLRAGKLNQPVTNTVKVCMELGVATPWIVAQGADIASRMFAEIGVGLEWRHDHCNATPAGSLVVFLSTGTPDEKFPGALGYSRPGSGDGIEVFYNRVLQALGPQRAPKLLAHVLAHEITHMLQGISRHSEDGLMKAHWAGDDFLQMSSKTLPFAPEDVQLIKNGLKARPIE
jgi:hypothetical protein